MYGIFKILVKCGLNLYCRKIYVNDTAVLNWKGPLLLACNHPNSFLDAVIIGSRFNQPVHFLARGDAFRKPWAKKILTYLNVIPIYRLSEGKENLALNDATFEACRDVLLKNGILLIFSEGLCVNDWRLRALKKGSARIAVDAWQQLKISDKFMVLPVSISYNSFTYFGKTVVIHFDQAIIDSDLSWTKSNGEIYQQFNQKLSSSLSNGMIESKGNDKAVQMLISNHPEWDARKLTQYLANAKLIVNSEQLSAPYYICGKFAFSLLTLIVLTVPAVLGAALHSPLYYPLKLLIRKKTKGTVFFDSVLFGMLLICYPLYFILLNIFFWNLTGDWVVRIIGVLLPLLAWVTIYWKIELQSFTNLMKLDGKAKKTFENII